MDKFRRQSYIKGPLTVSKDGTGQDVTFYGATSGCKFLWDASVNQMEVQGTTKLYGAVTLSAAGRVYKEKWLGPDAWDVTGSGAAEGQYNSKYRTLLLTPTNAQDTTEDVYAWWPTPDDLDTSASMTVYVYWSADTAAASQAAEMAMAASYFADGEAAAGTAASVDSAKYVASASDANVIEVSTLTSSLAPPSAGEIMGIHFQYTSAGSSTTGSDFQFHGLKLRYYAATLGTAT